MRDAHAPDHHMITVPKTVYVEAEPGAHVAQGCELRGLGARKIVVGREFDVLWFTREGGDLQPRPFGERGVVGEVVAARRFCAPVRVEKGGKTKRLRRLHHTQSRAVERTRDAARRVDALYRLGDGENRNRGTALPSGRDRTRD